MEFSTVRKKKSGFSSGWESCFHQSANPLLHRSKSRNGLTLIEVLLAMVILGIGAGVLMLATARCLAVIAKVQRYSTAQRLILQVGAEHPLTRGTVNTGSESGAFDNGFTWEREITEDEDENREGLYTVRTRVNWSDRGRESFEEIITWHYIPPEEER
jgi:prepilin-type N-terminal cleavage/methylation domain-containing protein